MGNRDSGSLKRSNLLDKAAHVCVIWTGADQKLCFLVLMDQRAAPEYRTTEQPVLQGKHPEYQINTVLKATVGICLFFITSPQELSVKIHLYQLQCNFLLLDRGFSKHPDRIVWACQYRTTVCATLIRPCLLVLVLEVLIRLYRVTSYHHCGTCWISIIGSHWVDSNCSSLLCSEPNWRKRDL